MRRFILAGVVAIAMSACNNQAPPQGGQPDAAQAPAQSPQTAAGVANPDFPEGLQPDFSYKLRSRKTEESADGPIHRLVIEFKQGDKATVDGQIEKLLVAKGYKRYKNFQEGDGLVGDYGNNGKRVTVTTSPANGKLVLDPDSLGTVYFVWKD